MSQAVAAEVPSTPATTHINEFVTVPETTLPGGLVVPSFQVGKYPCSKSDDGLAIIVADRKPWHSINYHDSVAACQASEFNLITETQWLAIAYQISQQPENWTSGKVGEGDIFQGLYLGTVSEAQDGNCKSSNQLERVWHVLSNGERIFHFAGNLYSWVFDNVQGDAQGIITKEFAEDSPTVTTAPYPSRTHGIGYADVAGDDWSGRALVRGGYWSSGSNAGVFYVNRDRPSSHLGRVGFRVTKSL